jgi:hypothetical protein
VDAVLPPHVTHGLSEGPYGPEQEKGPKGRPTVTSIGRDGLNSPDNGRKIGKQTLPTRTDTLAESAEPDSCPGWPRVRPVACLGQHAMGPLSHSYRVRFMTPLSLGVV